MFLYWHGSDSSIWKLIFELWYKMINHYISQFKIWNIHILPRFFFLVTNFKNLYDMFDWWPVSLFNHSVLNLSDTTILCVCLQAWRVAVHGVSKSRTRLSDWTELNWTNAFPWVACAVNGLSRLLRLPFVWLGLWELNILL